MAENEMSKTLDWMKDSLEFQVTVPYDDASPTPKLVITPGTDVIDKGQEVAVQVAGKMYGRDVRAALANWLIATASLVEKGLMSAQQMQQLMVTFQASMTTRIEKVEQRQTTTEATVAAKAKEMTDAAAVGGEPYAAEVIDIRTNPSDGKTYDSAAARINAMQALIDMYVPSGYTITIAHGLGRNPTAVTVFSFSDGLGVETNGLGTSASGLGGTALLALSPQLSYPDANTVQIDLPAGYKLNGGPVLMPDGAWYIIDGNEELKIVIE
jgi:hypothetical protein